MTDVNVWFDDSFDAMFSSADSVTSVSGANIYKIGVVIRVPNYVSKNIRKNAIIYVKCFE